MNIVLCGMEMFLTHEKMQDTLVVIVIGGIELVACEADRISAGWRFGRVCWTAA